MAPRQEFGQSTEKLIKGFEIDYGSFEEVNNRKFWNESDTNRKQKRKNGPFKLFANKTDILLMVIGACCAVIQGSCYPILSIIFGQMTDSFIQLATQPDLTTLSPDNITEAIIPNALTNSFNDESFSREKFNNKMIQYSYLYLLIGGIVLFNAFLQTFCWEWVAERQVHRLRKVFFSQVLRQDIQWFDQNESGNLPLKLSDDLERVRNGIGCKFSLVIQYLSTFVSGIIVGFVVNWRLTLVIVLIGPFLIAISSYIAKATAGSAAREQMKYAVAGSIAEEVIVNIRTVAAFCKESFEMKRYKRALDEGRKIAMQNYWVLACGVGSILFLMYLSYGFAFYYGAGLVVNGFCAPGSIFTVFLSVMAGAFSVGNALPFINCVSAAVGAASAIFNVIDRIPDIDSYSNKGFRPHSVNGCIELKNLSFKYPARPEIEVIRGAVMSGTRDPAMVSVILGQPLCILLVSPINIIIKHFTQVLHDVSIKIEPGKVVAFVGSSGAGKSTLVGLVLRLYDPTEGLITLDDIPLHQLNVHWLRNQIGVVSQDPILFSGTIAENIRYGRADVTQEEMEEAARIANAHYFISKLPKGYNTQVGERGSQLSGGQNQRIAISRALVRNPKILLLDEATSALDSLSESIVQEAFEKAMRGRTTIIIAHRLSTVRNSDRIYVIKDGYVAESGKHEELLSRKNLYYNLVLAQSLNKAVDETNVREWNEKSHSDSRCYPSRNSSLASSYNEFDESVFEFKEENLPDISVWQLVKFNSKEWLALSIGVLMCAVTGLTMPLFSVFYSQIFIIFTLPRERIMLHAEFWSKMFIFLAIISGIAMFSQTVCMTHAAEKLIMRMRSKAFNNILKQPVGWFDLESSSSGNLITRLARDAPLVKAASGLRVGHVITAIVTMVSGFAIALYFGWKLTLVLCIGAPFIAGATYQQNMILKKNQIRDSKLMETAGRIASECIQNIRTVQALGNEKLFVDQYMESLELPLKEAKKYALSFGSMFSLSQTIIYIMYAIAFRYGSYLIQKGEMSPENTYSVFFALSFCAASVGNTLSFLQDYSKAKLAARRMMQLINRKSEIDPTEAYGTRPEMHGNILFKSVYFTYPSRVDVNVLQGLSFSLTAGKTLALVGESGSGKSTVVSLLERFYNPAAGLIEIEQHSITTINVRHLRRNMGIVTQIPVLFDYSIKDNIAYGLINRNENDEIVMQKVIAAAKSVNIHNFITSLPLGYDTLVGEKGTQLSGGQKQRIAIARALIKNPKILLLDEATSALDPECEKIVQDTLDRARKGRTCITIAHRLSTVQNADIIAVVHKGKIVETGTHAELLSKKGYYYKLTEGQHI